MVNLAVTNPAALQSLLCTAQSSHKRGVGASLNLQTCRHLGTYPVLGSKVTVDLFNDGNVDVVFLYSRFLKLTEMDL